MRIPVSCESNSLSPILICKKTCIFHFCIYPQLIQRILKHDDDFESLVSDTRKFSRLGDIVLLGDFNARAGHNAYFIYDDSDAEYAT